MKQKTPQLPQIKTLSALLRELKTDIGEDYRAQGCEDDTVPSMDVTVGWDGQTRNGWGWQTGDNSYTGGAYGYPHWAVLTLTRRSNTRALARDIQDQLLELIS
jgi:hypothetical protein